MKKAWILAAVGLLTVVFALGAVACSDDDDTEDGDPTDVATEPAGGETPEAAAPIDVVINPVGDATVAGTATISPLDEDGTEVVVDVTGGLEEGSHQSHIHHGTCADPTGPIHVTLDNVEADATGAGSTTTNNPLDDAGATPPFAHWLDVDHYVAVHALDGAVVGCGDVTA